MTNEEYGRIVSKNLKRLAYNSGKMQMEIAKDLGISKQTLSSWMNGTRIPKMESIDMLAEYFGVTRTDIMFPEWFTENRYSAFERNIILAYRNASPERKESVRLLLGLQE